MCLERGVGWMVIRLELQSIWDVERDGGGGLFTVCACFVFDDTTISASESKLNLPGPMDVHSLRPVPSWQLCVKQNCVVLWHFRIFN